MAMAPVIAETEHDVAGHQDEEQEYDKLGVHVR